MESVPRHMVSVTKALALLTAFHFLFFWKLYSNPMSMATSELLSTFFPTWLNGGKRDTYWLNPTSHPVLSSYYPVNLLSSLFVVKRRLQIDNSFRYFIYSILLHFLFCSIGWFILLRIYTSTLIALFGAITFTYQAAHLRQQPCLIYTIAWFPWIAICPPLAIGMILLAGYYPLSLYLLPMGLFLNHDPISWVLGFAIGSIQLVPFLRYLPKTIKSVKNDGTVCPPWEKKFYFGVIPILILILNPQWRYLWILAPIVISLLLKNYLPRVHQRMWIISTYLAIFLSLQVLSSELAMGLCIVQCLDLYLNNSSLLPPRPWCELYQRPSVVFERSKLVKYLDSHLKGGRVAGLPWPLFTGLANGWKTMGYCGSMQLKIMYKWRKSFSHGIEGLTDDQLTRYNVRFCYSRKKLDKWLPTPIRYLYRNPAF